MSNQPLPLSNAEREELEALRADKAAREAAEKAAREREELERLRAEKTAHDKGGHPAQRIASDAAEDARVREARERGRKLMEPDDDLSMPLGQKIVLAALALIVVVLVAAFVWGPRS